MNKKGTTLKDVALRCGVSVATASYVLNGKNTSFKISEQSVRRVLEESLRMNYRPDQAALELEKLKRKKLSVLMYSPWIHSQYSDFMFQVNQVFDRALQENQIKIDSQFFSAGQLHKILKPFKCEKYDIVLIMGTNADDELFLVKKCIRLKNIILLHRNNENFISSCGNDGEICMQMADRLLDRSYYNKYVLVHNQIFSPKEAERIEGYKKAFAKYGDFHEVIMETANDDFAEDLLECFGKDKVCFIFTMYITAAKMLKYMIQQNINVPHESGIVGYDCHSLLDKFMTPALTTIDPDYRAMAEEVLHLGKVIKNGDTPFSHITKAKIVEGNSAII